MPDELTYLRQAYERLPDAPRAVEQAARARLAATMTPRRRLSRPSILLAAALVVGVTGLAAPAIGGRGPVAHVIEFLRGDPPSELVEGLEHLDRGAPAGMEQRPIVPKTRKVFEAHTEFGVVRIWLTPTKTGRLCENFEAPDEHGRTRPFGGGCIGAAPSRPIEHSASLSYDIGYVHGRVSAEIERLELEYANGGRRQVPLQNGFFAAATPPERVPRGTDQPARLIGIGAGGDVVHIEDLRGFLGERLQSLSVERPPVAMVAQESHLVSIAVDGARAVLFESPSRTGGTCARLAVAGKTWHWDCGGTTERPRLPIRWSLHRVPAGGQAAVVISGLAQKGVRVEFHYEDGSVESLPLYHRRFLTALARERWQPGKRLQAIVGIDESGADRIRFPMATTGARFYTGPTDENRVSAPRHHVWRPEWPLVARVEVQTAKAGEISLEIRRGNEGKWAETLRHGGRTIGGGEVTSYPNGKPDAPVSIEWVPVMSDDGKRDAYLYKGQLRIGDALRVVYRDRSTERVPIVRPSERVGPNLGFFLFEVTDERRTKGFARFEALNAQGEVVASVPAPPVS